MAVTQVTLGLLTLGSHSVVDFGDLSEIPAIFAKLYNFYIVIALSGECRRGHSSNYSTF